MSIVMWLHPMVNSFNVLLCFIMLAFSLREVIDDLRRNNVQEKIGWNIFVRHIFYIISRST